MGHRMRHRMWRGTENTEQNRKQNRNVEKNSNVEQKCGTETWNRNGEQKRGTETWNRIVEQKHRTETRNRVVEWGPRVQSQVLVHCDKRIRKSRCCVGKGISNSMLGRKEKFVKVAHYGIGGRIFDEYIRA